MSMVNIVLSVHAQLGLIEFKYNWVQSWANHVDFQEALSAAPAGVHLSKQKFHKSFFEAINYSRQEEGSHIIQSGN